VGLVAGPLVGLDGARLPSRFWLGYRGIKASTETGILLGAFEIVVFVALALTLIVQAGSDNTLEVFGTHYANNPDYSGFSGVIVGSIYTILAFIGFEEAAPIAEEAHEPHRTVNLAIIFSCLGIGLFYILNTCQHHHVRAETDDPLRRCR
jgi:amino acid transporter